MTRRLWSWVLACALVAAHTLGAVHAVAHAKTSAASPATTVGKLFKAHDDGGCKLFDQLSHGDALAGHVALPGTAEPVVACPPVLTVTVTAAAPAAHARGPPVLG